MLGMRMKAMAHEPNLNAALACTRMRCTHGRSAPLSLRAQVHSPLSDACACWAARGLRTPGTASSWAMAGLIAPFSTSSTSSTRRDMMSASEAQPVTHGCARHARAVSVTVPRSTLAERTRAGSQAARRVGRRAHRYEMLEKMLPILGTRPGVNREPSGRSRGRVSQACALTTASG